MYRLNWKILVFLYHLPGSEELTNDIWLNNPTQDFERQSTSVQVYRPTCGHAISWPLERYWNIFACTSWDFPVSKWVVSAVFPILFISETIVSSMLALASSVTSPCLLHPYNNLAFFQCYDLELDHGAFRQSYFGFSWRWRIVSWPFATIVSEWIFWRLGPRVEQQ